MTKLGMFKTIEPNVLIEYETKTLSNIIMLRNNERKNEIRSFSEQYLRNRMRECIAKIKNYRKYL